jgi:hypothetical protein
VHECGHPGDEAGIRRSVNSKTRNFVLCTAALLLACVAFTVAMARGIGTPRLLTTVFVLAATIIGVLLSGSIQGFRGDQDDLMQAVSTNQLTARERRTSAPSLKSPIAAQGSQSGPRGQ